MEYGTYQTSTKVVFCYKLSYHCSILIVIGPTEPVLPRDLVTLLLFTKFKYNDTVLIQSKIISSTAAQRRHIFIPKHDQILFK